MQDHIEQTALQLDEGWWHVLDQCALPTIVDEVQGTGPLRHEHASIRQERQSPRRVQLIGDDLDAQGSSERLIRRRRLRAYETNTTGDDERLAHALRDHRSEERRGGKECRNKTSQVQN